MQICEDVPHTFKDRSTNLVHHCADYACYRSNPVNSPAECRYYCPEYYNCLVNEFNRRHETTTTTSEGWTTIAYTDLLESGDSVSTTGLYPLLIGLSVALVFAVVAALTLFAICMTKDCKNRKRRHRIHGDDPEQSTQLTSPVESNLVSISESTHQETSFHGDDSQTCVKATVGMPDRQVSDGSENDEHAREPFYLSRSSRSIPVRERTVSHSSATGDQVITLVGPANPMVVNVPEYAQTNQGPLHIKFARSSFRRMRESMPIEYTNSPSSGFRSNIILVSKPTEPSIGTSTVPDEETHPKGFYRSQSAESTPSVSQPEALETKSLQRQTSQTSAVPHVSLGTQTDSGEPTSIEAAVQTDETGIDVHGAASQRLGSAIQESDIPLSIPTQESSSYDGLDNQSELNHPVGQPVQFSPQNQPSEEIMESEHSSEECDDVMPGIIINSHEMERFRPEHDIQPHPRTSWSPFSPQNSSSTYPYPYQSHIINPHSEGAVLFRPEHDIAPHHVSSSTIVDPDDSLQSLNLDQDTERYDSSSSEFRFVSD